MQTAKKIIKTLKGKNLTYVNAEKIANDLGYSIIFFNTALGDMEIERYNLGHKKSLKAFTYSNAAKIIFIDGALHSDDRLYLLLHEIGHIALGHIGDGRLMTRNQILIEFEADSFAYSIITGRKSSAIYILISAIILSSAIVFSAITAADKGEYVSANTENYDTAILQQEHMTDIVYITPSGTKFHRKDCMYTKNKTLTALPRSEASQQYAPCKVCKP